MMSKQTNTMKNKIRTGCRLIHPVAIVQKGFTLVEIMVAITLSLILMAGVGQIYLSSKESFRIQNELAQIQENQRIAVQFLQHDIRQAGFVPFGAVIIPNSVSVTDGGSNTNGVALSDSITISYTADKDCLGQDAPDGIAVNTYSIDNDRLMCNGNGGGAKNAGNQPIADGVSNMQILLGVDSNPDNDSTSMKSADAYVNATSSMVLNNVVSVRIALLVRSAGSVKKQDANLTYNLLDVNVKQTDRIKRQVVTTTIPLRNVNNV